MIVKIKKSIVRFTASCGVFFKLQLRSTPSQTINRSKLQNIKLSCSNQNIFKYHILSFFMKKREVDSNTH